mgnify:CR=1 FL=1
MKNFSLSFFSRKLLYPSVILLILMTLLTGLAYPLLITGIARFSRQGKWKSDRAGWQIRRFPTDWSEFFQTGLFLGPAFCHFTASLQR